MGVASVGVSEAPQEEGEDGTGICFPHGASCKWACWESHIEHLCCCVLPPVCLSTGWAGGWGSGGGILLFSLKLCKHAAAKFQSVKESPAPLHIAGGYDLHLRLVTICYFLARLK